MHTLLSHVSLLKHLSLSNLVVKLLAAPDPGEAANPLASASKTAHKSPHLGRPLGCHPPLSVQSKLNANRFWLDKLIHD